MAWGYPHEFHDGVDEPASGSQVDDNFAAVRAKVEAVEALMGSSVYTAMAASTLNADHIVSATQRAFVVLTIQSPAGTPPTIEAKVLVGGKEVSQVAMVGEQADRFFVVSILVPPSAAWRVNSSAGFTVSESHMLF